jgi:mutator protein MutT
MNAERGPAPRSDIAVAVVEHEGRFLIGRRAAGLPLEGFWEFPGGKVEPQETPAAAAVRECLEETGLAVRVTGSYGRADHDYEHAAVRLHFFACAPVEPLRPVAERFQWVAVETLGQFAFPPANAGLLSRLTAGKTA